jgi:hypothetical protein
MKAILLNLICFFCATSLYPNKTPEIIEKQITLSEFTSLEISAPIKVFLIVSDTPQLRLKGPKEVLEQLITDVTLEKLSIRGKDGESFPNGIELAEVYISLPKVENISLNGNGTLEGRGQFSIKKLNLSLKGSGRMVLSVDGGEVFADLQGDGQILLIGIVDTATFQMKGASKIEAASLLIQNGVVKIEGKGQADLNVMQNLSVEIEGEGRVRYGGDPTLNKKISGKGEVSRF